MLAFNGRRGGKPALLLHLYVTTPVRTTFVLPLTISHRPKGQFGTVLSARIPTLAGGLGSVTEIDLTIGRNYTYRGQRAQLPQRQLRRPGRVPGRDLHPRPRQLLLRRRQEDRHHPRPRLPRPLARTSEAEAADAALVPAEVVGELVAQGALDLAGEQVAIVAEVPFQGVAVDDDPVLVAFAGDAVAVVLAVGVVLGTEVGDDDRDALRAAPGTARAGRRSRRRPAPSNSPI